MIADTDISRFIEAQKKVYENVLKELQQGNKTSHWMWFIFPQIKGLGFSNMSQYYSVKSIEEAKEYMKNDLLKKRLLECCDILLHLNNKTANEIFGYTDNIKLLSSLTLFEYLFPEEKIFNDVLKKYFNEKKDEKTIEILKSMAK